MSTPEQAALLAKHVPSTVMNGGDVWPEYQDCQYCDSFYPCDVHRMAELKDAEIAQAVSEAVERIVEALDAAVYESDNRYDRLLKDGLGGYEREAGRGGGIRSAIALLRSRDWSKGEADTHE